MNTSFVTTAYLIYLPVVIILTWYVAHTLFKHGKIFMLDIFRGREDIAIATNRLFELGFYLLNVGFVLLIMEVDEVIGSNQRLLEVLSTKLGFYSVYLGIMLFLNLYMFFRGRKISRQRQMEHEMNARMEADMKARIDADKGR